LAEVSRSSNLPPPPALRSGGMRRKERVIARDEAGIAREGIGGSERLLVELYLRGLDRRHLRRAALLVVTLEEDAAARRDRAAA
jgi:hypothetical protein